MQNWLKTASRERIDKPQPEGLKKGNFEMLVLTRKLGESIIVGNDILITVESISGSRVKLGLQAPVEVAIIRSEINMLDCDESSRSRETSTVTKEPREA